MDDLFAGVIIIYLMACGSLVPIYAIVQLYDARECREAHNVFRCEYHGEWRPASKATE